MKLAFAFLLVAAPLSAQRFGGNEYLAGASLNLALRGPWTAAGWKRPVPRFLLAQGISIGYELLLDSQTWNAPGHRPWRDLGGRALGYAMLEIGHCFIRAVL